MKALLLAAGPGTRLRPVTDTIPKCLVPIRGVPLLDIWLDLLLGGEAIERVLINTCHLADAVRAHVASSRFRGRIDLVYEPELLGTGGTLLANRDYFGSSPFLVAHADNLTRFDVGAFIARHRARPAFCALTMMTFETDTPRSCGIVEQDAQGVIHAMHEKSATARGTRANAAVYIVEPEIVAFIATLGRPPGRPLGRSVVDLSTEVLPAFLGRIAAFHNAEYHRDIGTPSSLRLAQAGL